MPKKSKTETKKLRSTTPTWLRWQIVIPLVLLIAIVGGYLVSRSSAAGWSVIASEYPSSSAYWTVTTQGLKLDKATFVPSATTWYRICFYGRSPSGTSEVNIQPTDFSTRVMVSGTKFDRHCSYDTVIQQSKIKYTPHLFLRSGAPLEVQRVIVERYL